LPFVLPLVLPLVLTSYPYISQHGSFIRAPHAHATLWRRFGCV
jgi:hypothetical protein